MTEIEKLEKRIADLEEKLSEIYAHMGSISEQLNVLMKFLEGSGKPLSKEAKKLFV